MREMRTRLVTFFAAALMLAAALPVLVSAQEKEKPKPASSPAEAWRQALPPESESVSTAEEAAPSAAAARPSREESERGLIALERKWMEAVKLRDASALSQLVSEDFALVSPRLAVASGDRDKYFDHALRDLKLTSYELDELAVRLYGRTALVSGRLTQRATVAGEDWGGAYLFTDVWVSRDGVWRVVSRHASLAAVKK